MVQALVSTSRGKLEKRPSVPTSSLMMGEKDLGSSMPNFEMLAG